MNESSALPHNYDMELVRERKQTERLLQHQREQDTTAFSPARWSGGGGSRKVRVGEPASEGGEVTLSLKGGAFPEGGIRAHRHYYASALTLLADNRVNSKFF